MNRTPLAGALLAAVLLVVGVFAVVPVRTDLTKLLPEGRTEAARLMLRELRDNPAASLILAGIEGAPEATLAAISDRMRGILTRDKHFLFVENGSHLLGRAALAELFAHRYLLSPADDRAAFAVPALRQDFRRILQGLQSSAAPLVVQFGLPDPTGAFPALLARWRGASRVRSAHGVWFASRRPSGAPRALLLIGTRANGVDLAAQDAAIAAIRRAFAAGRVGRGARLLLGGPAVLANDASSAIRDDVRLISFASIFLVGGLLIWRFRSPWVLAAIAVPMLLGLAAAAAVTALCFGFVQGITLGFGMTMLGVTADYPVLLVGHRKQNEPAAGTLRRIGRTFALAAVTAAIGLSGMAFAGAPGVAELGVFAATGVLAAAAATFWLLPRLLVAAGLAPLAAGDSRFLRRAERWRRIRPGGIAVVLAAGGFLVLHGGPAWQHELSALAPIPPADRAVDSALRSELGAPEPGQLLLVAGATREAVLRREEALQPVLHRLIGAGVVGGAEWAARLLPSVARQRARQAQLPDAATLATRVERARAGMPFSATAFNRFEADVAAARRMPPLRPQAINIPLLSTRIATLLVPRNGGWLGLIVPRAVHDPVRFAAAFKGFPDVIFVDVGRETAELANRFTRAMWPLMAGGAAASFVCLLVALRDLRRVGRVVGAIAASLLVTVAILTLAGIRLSLIHLVSLQFVAGVGLDYGLFFARTQVDEEERARTLFTILTCAAMALLTFGMLSFCRTPLLKAIGVTVAVGVTSALAFTFLLAGPKVAAWRH
ncbi:MAG: MMPL family transporter [Acetobacteraceae bacterium]